MKKLLLALFFVGITTVSFSQITKASVVSMLSEFGTTIDKVESLFIGNVKKYYTDNTWKKVSSRYNKTWENGTNQISISDLGIILKSYEAGKLTNIRLYPFSSIVNIHVEGTEIEIHLTD